MTPRIIVLNGLDARDGVGQRIWIAEVSDHRLVRLERSRDLRAISDYLVAEARRTTDLVVGIDFAVSLPEWFFAELRWNESSQHESHYLDWPGEMRPERRNRSAGSDPVPQWFRASSLQDVRMLGKLREGGFAIWPMDPPTVPLVIEISAHALEDVLTSVNEVAWEDYLTELCPTLDPVLRRRASGSEYACDAAISALIMAEHYMEFMSLPSGLDAPGRLEGGIWLPTLAPPAEDDEDARELLAYSDTEPSEWPEDDVQGSEAPTLRAFSPDDLEADADRWEELVSSMLPAPVRMWEPGIIIGGDPGEVVVSISPEYISILEFGVRWSGHTPVDAHVPVAAFPLHGTRPHAVAGAIIQARSDRLRSYGWCACCGALNPPEWMHDAATCQGCAARQFGVVY